MLYVKTAVVYSEPFFKYCDSKSSIVLDRRAPGLKTRSHATARADYATTPPNVDIYVLQIKVLLIYKKE